MDVRLPRLGEGADSGTVSTIFVKEGDTVKKDQAVFELESEKAVASIPSPLSGTIAKIYVKEGDAVKVGQLIFALSEGGTKVAAAPAPRPVDASVGDDEEAGTVVVGEEPAVPNERPTASEPIAVLPRGVPPPASPSIRRLARDLGVDLARVRGSQRGGRIVMADLKRYIQQMQRASAQPAIASAPSPAIMTASAEAADFSKWGKITTEKLTTLRRTISSKMVDSWRTIPHVTQFDEADVTSLLSLRKKYASKYGKKGGHLTFTTFAMKVAVESLKKHPIFNASLDDRAGEIVFKAYYHIGIAVDTEHGLIVPVIRDVDKKSLLQLSIELEELADRTRQRKVGLDEMQGGSFTISNQGGIGSAHFTPIINKPQVAILGIGRGAMRPVVIKGKVQERMMLPLGLSYDHRVIDGADAARFMVDLVQGFENFKEADVKI
jgi:pyruvate dehydrogenase E2 component (dihydrolipoamide acetyltransferase)